MASASERVKVRVATEAPPVPSPVTRFNVIEAFDDGGLILVNAKPIDRRLESIAVKL